MSSTTPYLGLTLYDSTTDQAVAFATFRAVWGGPATSSNFYKIDTGLFDLDARIDILESYRGAIPVAANYISANYYEASGITGITAYTSGTAIVLSLDTTSSGTVTLNINALGTKSLMKIDSTGTAINLTGSDLVKNRRALFVYDGTRWLWVSANSADQISIVGTAGNVVTVNTDNTLLGTLTQSLLISQTINAATAKTTPVDADRFGFWDSVSGLLNHVTWANLKAVPITYPSQFDRLTRITGGAAGAETTLVITPAGETMNINVDGNLRIVPDATSLDIDTSGNWIATTYATPANRAGKDFRIYAIENGGALAPTIQCDLAATAAPANSRLIGGFHCLAVAVGTIASHTLTGYAVGDILPQSVWDLKWCPRRRPDGTYHGGMVYSAAANIWVDIYLMSGTGSSTASVNGGTISDTRNWMDFVDDAGAVGKRLLRDREFQLAAAGCNEGTNITGSADPTTTGGHTDTAGRRMISNIGCEDMAGVMWQWLDEQSFQYASTASFGWVNQTGGKGQLYLQGATADVKLLAGGRWADGTDCGSRGRYAGSYRWTAYEGFGGRAGVEPE